MVKPRETQIEDLIQRWRKEQGMFGRREAANELESALLREEAPQWQPIETAPKDGTRVFVYGWQYGVSLFGIGYWFQPRTIKELGGWICHTLPGHEFVSGTFSNPTHWMPLPIVPKSPSAPIDWRGVCYCRKHPCICSGHDAECEAELTSHGYTPCRCTERAAPKGGEE